jgi:hypothetical protein
MSPMLSETPGSAGLTRRDGVGGSSSSLMRADAPSGTSTSIETSFVGVGDWGIVTVRGLVVSSTILVVGGCLKTGGKDMLMIGGDGSMRVCRRVAARHRTHKEEIRALNARVLP